MIEGQAQDPHELFDIVTTEGAPTGQVKERALVHRDGDWHRAVHVWVAGIDDDGPFVLMQRRSPAKDTMPNRLDVAVGGHYRAGEHLDDVLREVEEELGVPVTADQLRSLGTRICLYEPPDGGMVEHELQDVFLWRRDESLNSYRPNPHELSALIKLPIPPLLSLLAGEQTSISGEQRSAGDLTISPVILDATEFSQRIDRYFYRAVIAIDAALHGARHVAV
jgi:isopentenyldiphosphate isomerase